MHRISLRSGTPLGLNRWRSADTGLGTAAGFRRAGGWARPPLRASTLSMDSRDATETEAVEISSEAPATQPPCVTSVPIAGISQTPFWALPPPAANATIRCDQPPSLSVATQRPEQPTSYRRRANVPAATAVRRRAASSGWPSVRTAQTCSTRFPSASTCPAVGLLSGYGDLVHQLLASVFIPSRKRAFGPG
jgi:hypothetical protein